MKDQEKGAKVQAIFDDIAPQYDRMNRIITVGQDLKWRTYLIQKANIKETSDVLDIACGTGDIALEIKQNYPGARVMGLDFSHQMLEVAKKRDADKNIEWIQGDAQDLPFQDEAFDHVVFGFLLRNVSDLELTLKEIFRVLKPGGRALSLDTTPPAGLLKWPVEFTCRRIIPMLAKLVGSNPKAYAYLAESSKSFHSAKALERKFQDVGFEQTGHRLFYFKTVAVHWAQKPS